MAFSDIFRGEFDQEKSSIGGNTYSGRFLQELVEYLILYNGYEPLNSPIQRFGQFNNSRAGEALGKYVEVSNIPRVTTMEIVTIVCRTESVESRARELVLEAFDHMILTLQQQYSRVVAEYSRLKKTILRS